MTAEKKGMTERSVTRVNSLDIFRGTVMTMTRMMIRCGEHGLIYTLCLDG